MLRMPIPEIEEILGKYKNEEETLDSKLNQKTDRRVKTTNNDGTGPQKPSSIKTLQHAKERNALILKNLETVKGNLRSKAIFSPSEMQWKKIYEKYQSEPALVVNRWRCHLPIYI